MTRQEKILEKNKRGRPAIGVGVQINAMFRPEVVEALDRWIAAQPEPRPTRPEGVRLALKDWLIERGFLKTPPLDPAEVMDEIARLEAKAAALKHDGTPSPDNALKTMKRAVVKNETTKLRNKLTKKIASQ